MNRIIQGLVLILLVQSTVLSAAIFDVKTYGAKGDGKTLDTAAINKAIDAAAAAGGGTVYLGPGVYVSGSIVLKSHITFQIDAGATLEATTEPVYDKAEPNQFTQFQDFGHSHWHNSLIWGENLEDVAIVGSGRINGKGLVRDANANTAAANKAIALKLCRNVTIRDISILSGGHFAILATGIDNFTIDNIKIDTNRDGIDVDSCRNVRISNTSVNSPNDDAIVLKSSYALGFARATENTTITNCFVSGYEVGSLLDGTYKRTVTAAPDRDGPTGRIKFGTESNGGFKNITISNCVFDRSRGLSIESVDGGPIEDIAVSNITMRDVSNTPIWIRLGGRMRGPAGTPASVVRRISISNVVVYDADPRFPSVIAGIPGHDIEDLKLSDIRIVNRGGLTMEQVAQQPASLVNTFFFRSGIPPRDPYDVPEREKDYPEPSVFGLLPAYGFYIRHVNGIEMNNVHVSFAQEDHRPAFVLDEVKNADFQHVKAQKATGTPTFVLRKVEGFQIHQSTPVADTKIDTVDRREF